MPDAQETKEHEPEIGTERLKASAGDTAEAVLRDMRKLELDIWERKANGVFSVAIVLGNLANRLSMILYPPCSPEP